MSDRKTILFSVAHSSVAEGAASQVSPLTEYMASSRATLAAVRNLAGFVGLEMLDVFRH